jgi:TatD DNase family protein
MTKTRDPLVDIGANLTHDSFEEDRQQVLDRAVENGVLQMVVTGASIQGSEDAVALSATNDKLFATVGIHPHNAE